MPIPAHKRVQVQGTLLQGPGGGSDIFEFGWADSSALSVQALAEAMAPVINNAWANPDYSISVSLFAQLTGVRVEQVNADGTVSGSFFVPIAPVVGDANGVRNTLVTLCCTLETMTSNGSGRYVQGRFYPPAYPGDPEGSTFALGDAQGYAASWAQLMKDVVTAGGVPVVASKTAGGQLANVTAISCTTVIDTQRRRKNHVTSQRTPKYTITP